MRKNCTPLTQFLPIVSSCIIIVQYHSQGINIDTDNTQNVSITIKILCVAFFFFFNNNSHTHFPPATNPSLIAGNHYFVPHFYNFVIWEILYQWNHTVYNLPLGIVFTQCKSLKIHPSCCMDQWLAFFYWWRIP